MSLEEIRYGENITRDDKSLGSSSEEYRNLKVKRKKWGQQRRFRKTSEVEGQVDEWDIPKLWRKYV